MGSSTDNIIPPNQFQTYLEKLEKLSIHNKPNYVMGDFNIDPLNPKPVTFSQLSFNHAKLFVCPIDKLTRVYNKSATLIENKFVNRVEGKLSSGNIVPDISDHYSQFALFDSSMENSHLKKCKVRDTFRKTLLTGSSCKSIGTEAKSSVDKSFDYFYNKLNKLVNKHAPLKSLSRQQAEQFSKPWISSASYGNQLKSRIHYSDLETRRNISCIDTKSQV